MTKDVIAEINSVDEFRAALLLLDAVDVVLAIVLAFDLTALSLFFAKYREDKIDLRLEELVLHFDTYATEESSYFLQA